MPLFITALVVTLVAGLAPPPAAAPPPPAPAFVPPPINYLQISQLPANVDSTVWNGFTVTAYVSFGGKRSINTSYTGTVVFSSSDNPGSVPGNYTFTQADGGTHSFPARGPCPIYNVPPNSPPGSGISPNCGAQFVTAGQQTLTVTESGSGDTVLTATATTSCTKPNLSIGQYQSSLMAGATTAATVSAISSYSNLLVTGFSGPVQLSSSDPIGTVPGAHTFTATDHGSFTFPANACPGTPPDSCGVTLRTVGAQTMTATASAGYANAATAAITVGSGPATQLLLSLYQEQSPAGSPPPFAAYTDVIATNPLGVQVTAVNQYGMQVANYTGTIHFTVDGTLLPGTYSMTSGQQVVHRCSTNGCQAPVVFATAGSHTLGVADSVGMTGSLSGPVSVLPNQHAAWTISNMVATSSNQGCLGGGLDAAYTAFNATASSPLKSLASALYGGVTGYINAHTDPRVVASSGSALGEGEWGSLTMTMAAAARVSGDLALLNNAFNWIDRLDWNYSSPSAVCWVLDSNLQPGQAPFYSSPADCVPTSFSPAQQPFDLAYDGLLIGAALLYDWNYASLTPYQRDRLRYIVDSRATKFYTASSAQFWYSEYLQNHDWNGHAAMAIAGCALTTENNPLATNLLQTALTNFKHVRTNVIPNTSPPTADGTDLIPDGTWHEGPAYEGSSWTALIPGLEALRVAGPNFTHTGSSDLTDPGLFYANFSNFRTAMYMPEAPRLYPVPYADYYSFDQTAPAILRWEALKYKGTMGGNAVWLAEQWRNGGPGNTSDFPTQLDPVLYSGMPYGPDEWALVLEMLYWIDDKPIAPAIWGDKLLSDPGIAVLRDKQRSDHTGKTMIAALKSGASGGVANFNQICAAGAAGGHDIADLPIGHDHADDNGVYMSYGADLLIPEAAGYFIGQEATLPDRGNTTAYHNSLLLRDPNGPFPGSFIGQINAGYHYLAFRGNDPANEGLTGKDATLFPSVAGNANQPWFCLRKGNIAALDGTGVFNGSYGHTLGNGGSLYYNNCVFGSNSWNCDKLLNRFDRHVFMSRPGGTGHFAIVRDAIQGGRVLDYKILWHLRGAAPDLNDSPWIHGHSVRAGGTSPGDDVGIFVASPSAPTVVMSTQSVTKRRPLTDTYNRIDVSPSAPATSINYLHVLVPIAAMSNNLWTSRPVIVPLNAAGDVACAAGAGDYSNCLTISGTYNAGGLQVSETEAWTFSASGEDSICGPVSARVRVHGAAGVVVTPIGGGSFIRAAVTSGDRVGYNDGTGYKDLLVLTGASGQAESRWTSTELVVEWSASGTPPTGFTVYNPQQLPVHLNCTGSSCVSVGTYTAPNTTYP